MPESQYIAMLDDELYARPGRPGRFAQRPSRSVDYRGASPYVGDRRPYAGERTPFYGSSQHLRRDNDAERQRNTAAAAYLTYGDSRLARFSRAGFGGRWRAPIQFLSSVLTSRAGTSLVNAGVNLAAQSLANDGDMGKIDPVDVVTSAAGGLAGFGRGLVPNVGIAAGLSGLTSTAKNWWRGENYDVPQEALVGAGSAGAGDLLGSAVASNLAKSPVSNLVATVASAVGSEMGAWSLNNFFKREDER